MTTINASVFTEKMAAACLHNGFEMRMVFIAQSTGHTNSIYGVVLAKSDEEFAVWNGYYHPQDETAFKGLSGGHYTTDAEDALDEFQSRITRKNKSFNL